MALRRRRLLALAGAALAPALAGCSPCGETWPGVGYDVRPLEIERVDGWIVDASLTVEFNFGREGFGLEGAALATFDSEGVVLDEAPVGDLVWADVPEAERESTDCGEFATVSREATLRSEDFPRWVGLRYDGHHTDYEEPTTVSRYPDASPGETVDPSGYESVDATAVAEPRGERAYAAPVSDVRFDYDPILCDERPTVAEVRRDDRLSLGGVRPLPADNHYPTLASLSHEGDDLVFRVGLRRAPRFRRGECLRASWSASVEFDRPADVPGTVALQYLDPDGDATSTRRIEVQRESE